MSQVVIAKGRTALAEKTALGEMVLVQAWNWIRPILIPIRPQRGGSREIA